MVKIEVSLGDALDRLSILDIKTKKIVDAEKLEHVVATKAQLDRDLSAYTDPYGYNILRYINEKLYDAETIPHSTTSTLQDHKKIKFLNTMRVNAKRYIDSKDNSSTIEQKSYTKKIGLFIGHHGYGDVILLNGAIRYASLQVDELYVFCKEQYLVNLMLMFSDSQTIKFLPCRDSMALEIPDTLGHTFTHEFISGVYLNNPPRPGYNITRDFYKDMSIPIDVMYSFFHVPEENQLVPPEQPYIFMQTKSSQGTVSFVDWDINEILTIDPNINQYEENHKFYDIAQKYIDQPIAWYVNLIKGAKEIHVVDSCFACMAWVLDLQDVKYYDRDTLNYSTIFQKV